MYCIIWAPVTMASSLVWSMEILEGAQGMGGERGRMVFILSAAAFSHPISWKICVILVLQLLVEPHPHPALILPGSDNTFPAFALLGLG